MHHLETNQIVETNVVGFMKSFEAAVLEGWRLSSSNLGYPVLNSLSLSVVLTKTPEEVKESLHTTLEVGFKGYVTESYAVLQDVQAAIIQGYSVQPESLYYDGLHLSVDMKRVERVVHKNLGYKKAAIVIPIVQYYSQPEIKEWPYETLAEFAKQPEIDSYHKDKAQMQKAVWQKLRKICPRVQQDIEEQEGEGNEA